MVRYIKHVMLLSVTTKILMHVLLSAIPENDSGVYYLSDKLQVLGKLVAVPLCCYLTLYAESCLRCVLAAVRCIDLLLAVQHISTVIFEWPDILPDALI